jgi:hypothetical protein
LRKKETANTEFDYSRHSDLEAVTIASCQFLLLPIYKGKEQSFQPQRKNKVVMSLVKNPELIRRDLPEWKTWGPYLSERQWGTVREDYSQDGSAWEYFSHEHARSRAYRWGEDGIAGISDDKQLLCFAPAFWNGEDEIIKERYFGLTGNEGIHGEDVKEVYYYLDNTPSHSFMRALYKYPQQAFPYSQLKAENLKRTKKDPEFELIDTGIFDQDRYFDIFIEYAKSGPEDILIRLRAINRGPEAAILRLIPQFWFRNTWAWNAAETKPELSSLEPGLLFAQHHELGNYYIHYENSAEALFCNNDTNVVKCFNWDSQHIPVKDGINDYVTNGSRTGLSNKARGTKAGLLYVCPIPSGAEYSIRLRMSRKTQRAAFSDFESIFAERERDSKQFYAPLQKEISDPEEKRIHHLALSGLLWSKQFYFFDVDQWVNGDSAQPSPPDIRRNGRNSAWQHLHNHQIIAMPDKWEYPWYAAWDLGFHCVSLALVDPGFAKEQVLALLQENAMHPNGQIPAYEWNFSDVNPPVQAWAAWRVYKYEKKQGGRTEGDLDFIERVLHKLMINFTWWVNRKDVQGHNIFQGGFLGLDNIGVFDRSQNLPTGGHIEQADGTAWMAMYCLNLMRMSLELSATRPVYQDLAIKFFDHFLHIARAMFNFGSDGGSLWDDDDKFYYDVLHLPDGKEIPLKVRSLVGLIPLFAVEVMEPDLLKKVPKFQAYLENVLQTRPELASLVSRWQEPGKGERRLLSLLRGHRMKRLLQRLLDETEFLSPYGIRALSKFHAEHPFEFQVGKDIYRVAYQPAESDSGLFGGNSNWRGPIWFPVNYLLIESLRKFYRYYGADFKVECPTGSGNFMNIAEVSMELNRRLVSIFKPDQNGKRPAFGKNHKMQTDPHFKDYLLFNEYFNGDTGEGLGASHQTGWTALVARLIQMSEMQ